MANQDLPIFLMQELNLSMKVNSRKKILKEKGAIKTMTQKELAKQCTQACLIYERKCGSVLFMKKAMSAITKLLVKKGIATEREFQQLMIKELKNEKRA
jgi:hypothetical protein